MDCAPYEFAFPKLVPHNGIEWVLERRRAAMKTEVKQRRLSKRPKQDGQRVSKKDQIISLYLAGITEVEDLAMITKSPPARFALTTAPPVNVPIGTSPDCTT